MRMGLMFGIREEPQFGDALIPTLLRHEMALTRADCCAIIGHR